MSHYITLSHYITPTFFICTKITYPFRLPLFINRETVDLEDTEAQMRLSLE